MRRKLNIKLVASVVGGLFVFSVGVHFLHGYQVQRNAYRLRERAEQAVNAKDDGKALTYYAQYLKLAPEDVDSAQKYVEILDRRPDDADPEDLVVRMENVLRFKSDQHELRFRLVHNLLLLDRTAEALANLKKLQTTWPDKAEVLHMIGWCQEALREYPQAVQSFEEAIRINPKQIRSYALLAEVLQDRLTQPDEAHKVLDQLVQANAESHQAYLWRAHYRRNLDEKGAENDLQTAFKLAPDKPEVILAVADAARARGNWTEAVKLLQDGLKRFPKDTDFYKRIADVKMHTAKNGEAIDHLKAGLAQAPKSNELAVLLIDLLIDEKQYTEARMRIAELLKAGMRPALSNYLHARLAIADKQWHEAIKLLDLAQHDLGAGSDWTSRVQVLLGLSYRQIGDYDQELQAFRRAVQDEPTWTTANIGLATALLNNGRFEEAAQTLEPMRTAKDLPAEYWLLLSRARIYRQLRLPEPERRWESVEESLGKAAPTSIETATARAQMLAARGDFVAAKTVLEKVRADHPADIALTCALADLAARQNQFNEAEKILNQADDLLEVRLAKCRLWSSRGDAVDRAKLARLGDLPEGKFTPEQRARLGRELADAWQRLGDGARAESLRREVARQSPKDLRSRSALLDIALQKNQVSAARAWLDELRALEGEQGRLWRFGEAAILVHDARGQGSPLDDARKKLHELDQLHKNWSRVAVLSGAISELEGKLPQAIQEYTRALELGETQPRVLMSLLRLLVQRREFGKAEAELTKYEQKVSLTPELARMGAEVALGMRDGAYARLALKRAEQAAPLPVRDYRDALWLARIYRAAGETTKAEVLLRDSLKEAGHTPDTWIAWMEHLQQTKQRELALQELERLKKELPASRQPLTIARSYEALHLADQADKVYQDSLRTAPEDFILLAFAADFYRRADRNAEAVKLYERLLDPSLAAPSDYTVPARRHLAVLLGAPNVTRALALLDDNTTSRGATVADERVRLFLQQSLRKFQDSLPQQPPTPDERLLLARLLESAGNLNDARSQLSELVDEYPAMAQYLVRYARLLIQMSELEDAERAIARLEALEPGSERAREVRMALTRAKQK
jgi:tetratricopeptide (TPR) repeat protein